MSLNVEEILVIVDSPEEVIDVILDDEEDLIIETTEVGPRGLPGIDGATWYVGVDVPDNGLGIDNDLYFRSSNAEVYLKTAGSWVLNNTIKLPVERNIITFGELDTITGTSRWYPSADSTIISIDAWVSVAPVGGDITFDLLKNGSIIVSGTILDGEYKFGPSTQSIQLLTTDYLTLNINTVGATATGEDLVVRLILTE